MTATDPGFEGLLEFLRASHGFDFTGYKRSTLGRRVKHRVGQLGLPGCEAYLEHLQAHPDEFPTLFDTILINVTGFFRDPAAWVVLSQSVLPRILEHKQEREQVRVWSAGCATGQEAYSLVMAFSEVMGTTAFRDRVKVFATDVDEEALQTGRLGFYPMRELDDVDEPLRDRYFEVQGDQALFRPDLRRCVVFGRHDLVQDAPISHIDLLVCRNTLMYFNADAQSRILGRLHYALDEAGILFLGTAEMLLSHTDLFSPVDSRTRIFTKLSRGRARERLLVAIPGGLGESNHVPLREASADALPVAQIVLDSMGVVTQVNDQARRTLDVVAGDIGTRFHDLEISYRPVELRSIMAEAQAQRRSIVVRDIEVPNSGGQRHFVDVHVTPLWQGEGGLLGTSVSFIDVTAAHQLQVELARSKQDLETAYEELQSANEELETTNEELQSTVEELETTNEELQSANEELETINEELQSTNGELQSINNELNDRTDELDRMNIFTESVLSSLHLGVIVLDPDMRVQIWNSRAAELWGLRADEVVGSGFLTLDIGLPVDGLAGALRSCISGESESESRVLDAHNRRGQAMRCRITCTPLQPNAQGRRGVVMLMEGVTVERDSAAELSVS